jgi:primosomal protein N' (replication factor Y) (superfamily II helicase)
MSEPAAKESVLPEFAEIALPLPLRRTFTYRLPPGLRDGAQIGARVLVPFGKRNLTGYVVEFHNELANDIEIEESAVRDAIEVLDKEPLLTPEILNLARWTADYYASFWGEVLKASLPAGLNAPSGQMISITDEGAAELERNSSRKAAKMRILAYLAENGETSRRELAKQYGAAAAQRAVRELAKENLISAIQRTENSQARPKRQKAVRLLERISDETSDKPLTGPQSKILEILGQCGGEMLFTELMETADVGASPVNTLAKRGYLEVFVQEVLRDPLAGAALPDIVDFTLSAEQSTVLAEIEKALESAKYKAFLLHGVTGSGKTEVYMRAMRSALDAGRSSVMLVPEIALTPVFSRRLRAVFGDEVAILHSSLSTGERFDEWRRIRSGDARIVIGTRSAVFAPLQNVGLVIVDEEHDSSYRQNESPFYNARDVAVMRASFADAIVVLGSATPSLESSYNAQTGKYTYLQMMSRIGARPLASAEIVDMREVFSRVGKDVPFSPRLLEAIQIAHARGEQSIILLNRRGFSKFVLCRSCGETLRCKNCDVTLTYHRGDARLVCHYCSHRVNVPDRCPFCESRFLHFYGEGTEQIEEILNKKFPDLRISRIDRDTIARRKDMEKTLMEFSAGEIDMLVGTQMLAKGHDFPNVTLVGVISVDTGLGLPDFRSAERTFQLLTQVAGRAGRGEAPGRVIIQTYYPDHYALHHAYNQDFEGFYKEEMRYRKNFHFPPFVVLASVLVKHTDPRTANRTAQIIKECLERADADKDCRITWVATASISRLKQEHRLQVLIRAVNRKTLRNVLETAFAEAEIRGADLKIANVEIDPVNLL